MTTNHYLSSTSAGVAEEQTHPTPVSAPVGVVEALRDLVRAVESMRVPQTVEDAALQIHVTIGPALEAAQAALRSPAVEGK